MCGGGNNAAAAAQAQETQRQAQIGQNVNQINAAFSNRQPQYDKYLAATRNLYQTEVGRQQGIAGRNLKFALARNGQTGGSVAADQGNELGREMASGTIQAEQKAQGALSSLQGQDNAERLQLISLAQSGADIGNAQAQSADALRANLGAAMSGQTANTLGDVFGGLSKNIDTFQNAAMTRKGVNAATANIYGNQSGVATGKGPFQ
jgi:hypothetical protein